MNQNNCCEQCDHYVYDDQFDQYMCEIDLDMDDTARLLSFSHFECPYFQFHDEYRIVRKQN